MANRDPYRIKARAADLDLKRSDVCGLMRDMGVECLPNNLSRAQTNEVKTPKDWEILQTADKVLKDLEAKRCKGV